MVLLDLRALDPHSSLLVHPSHSAIVHDARLIGTLHEQIVHASQDLVVTESGMYTYDPKRTLWEAPAPVLACSRIGGAVDHGQLLYGHRVIAMLVVRTIRQTEEHRRSSSELT